jgi:hypothetical protein
MMEEGEDEDNAAGDRRRLEDLVELAERELAIDQHAHGKA